MSKSSNSESKHVEELIDYVSILELLIQMLTFEDGSHFQNWQLIVLKNKICPHWNDIINELENKNV